MQVLHFLFNLPKCLATKHQRSHNKLFYYLYQTLSISGIHLIPGPFLWGSGGGGWGGEGVREGLSRSHDRSRQIKFSNLWLDNSNKSCLVDKGCTSWHCTCSLQYFAVLSAEAAGFFLVVVFYLLFHDDMKKNQLLSQATVSSHKKQILSHTYPSGNSDYEKLQNCTYY